MQSNFADGLRLIIFDRSAHRRNLPGLSTLWSFGRTLYRSRGAADGGHGAESWNDALAWLAAHAPLRAISEVQLWSHGKWGDARFRAECLDRDSLARGSAHYDALVRLRARLTPGALFWFRTCETFGSERGIAFAEAFADFMRCRVAGYTYVIGLWQSGLHALVPGERATWSADEGLAAGNAHAPEQAKLSTPLEPNTITCFQAKLPAWA